jgi:hypothetical protein
MQPSRTLAAVIAGAVAGAATSLLLARDPAPPAAAAPTPRGPLVRPVVLRAPAAAPAAREEPVSYPPPGPLAPAPRQEAEAEAGGLEQHQAAIARHREDPVDPAWAPSARASFTADLGALASEANPFAVVDVDCRQRSCLALLEWPSFGAAVSGHLEVVGGAYEVDCVRRLLLPDPVDPGQPYQAAALFECEGAGD